jgi:Ala-tRNA(Pro) deacylase
VRGELLDAYQYILVRAILLYESNKESRSKEIDTMTISATLKEFLDQHRIVFELIPHPHTGSSMETAEQAHVPGHQLAKAVIIKEGKKYSMVIIPSAEHVDLERLRQQFGHKVEMATEDELKSLFPDCAVGAIPPIGVAWGMETFLDESLPTDHDIYFEAGDHEDLVRISGEQFRQLLGKITCGDYCRTE